MSNVEKELYGLGMTVTLMGFAWTHGLFRFLWLIPYVRYFLKFARAVAMEKIKEMKI